MIKKLFILLFEIVVIAALITGSIYAFKKIIHPKPAVQGKSPIQVYSRVATAAGFRCIDHHQLTNHDKKH